MKEKGRRGSGSAERVDSPAQEHGFRELLGRRLSALLEATSDFVAVSDRHGRQWYVNRAGRRLLGLGDEEPVRGTLVTEHQPDWASRLVLDEGVPAAVRDGVWSGETSLISRDGREIPVSQVIVAQRSESGEIDFFATICRDISAQRRASEETSALLEITKEITASLGLEEVVERVQRRAAAALPCARVVTLSFDVPNGRAREFLASPSAREIPLRLPVMQRLLHGRTVVLADTPDEKRHPGNLPRRFAAAELIAAPLIVGDAVFGALVALGDGQPRPFRPDQVHLLENIARHVGIAFRTAELHRNQQEEAEVAAALVHVAREVICFLDTPLLLERLSQLATETLGCDCSHTLLLDPETDVYTVASGHGYTASEWAALRAVRVRREQLASMLPADAEGVVSEAQAASACEAPGPALCLPLYRGVELIGLLVAVRRDPNATFTRRQQRIGAGLGRLASLALQNARLLEELGRVSRLKSDFVATMSHELRTPLNTIIGYTDLLLDGTFGALNDEQQEKLHRVDNNAQNLLELINTTLDMSRLETGRLPVELEEVSVPDLVEQIDAETRELRSAKPDVLFSWEIGEDLPRLITDPMKFKVVLKNLISNAIKFTPSGSVRVSIAAENERVKLVVSDTGIGIPPEAHGVIFEPFRQLDGSTTRRHGGVGLGLYIVRRLVQVLGGTFELRSEVEQGSTFTVTFPLRPRPGA